MAFFSGQQVNIPQISPDLLMAPGRAYGRAFEKLGQSVAGAMERQELKRQKQEKKDAAQLILREVMPELDPEKAATMSADPKLIDSLLDYKQDEAKAAAQQKQYDVMAKMYEGQMERDKALAEKYEAETELKRRELDQKVSIQNALSLIGQPLEQQDTVSEELTQAITPTEKKPKDWIPYLSESGEIQRKGTDDEIRQRLGMNPPREDLLNIMSKRAKASGQPFDRSAANEILKDSGYSDRRDQLEQIKIQRENDRKTLGAPISDANVEFFSNIKTAEQSLSTIDKAYTDIVSDPDAEEKIGPLEGIITEIRGKLGMDDKARALIASQLSAITGFAKGVFGETGVLTEADVQRYMKTLPTLRTSKEVAFYVIKDLKMKIYGQAISRADALKGNNRDISAQKRSMDYGRMKKELNEYENMSQKERMSLAKKRSEESDKTGRSASSAEKVVDDTIDEMINEPIPASQDPKSKYKLTIR